MKTNVYWSDTVKWLSIIIGVLLIATVVCILIFDFSLWSVFMSVFILAVTIYAAYLSPMSIELNDTEMVLHKLIGSLHIPFDKITEIEPFETDGTEVRLCGSGGFLGYTGLFYNKKLGRYHSYVGWYKQAFLVCTENNKKYVFSCENRELIISTIKLSNQTLCK